MTKQPGWFGVDLDGTLAMYDGWKGVTHIGDPIPAMVLRVQKHIAAGYKVKVFTARMSRPDEVAEVAAAIAIWTAKHVGVELKATCVKDLAMIGLYDDRAIQVVPNTGVLLEEQLASMTKAAQELATENDILQGKLVKAAEQLADLRKLLATGETDIDAARSFVSPGKVTLPVPHRNGCGE